MVGAVAIATASVSVAVVPDATFQSNTSRIKINESFACRQVE